MINYYLPKKITDQQSLLNSINSIFLNDVINNDIIKRYDYITQSLMLLIEKENLNNHYKWISYYLFKKHLRNIINKNNDKISKSEPEKLIKLIENETIENTVEIKVNYDNNEQENKIDDFEIGDLEIENKDSINDEIVEKKCI